MSYIDEIANRANQLTKRFATRDPFEIAENLGINVFFTKELTTLKGMYFVMKRNRYIYINDNLDERSKRIVCAHELGHDQLHRDLAKLGALQEFVLYDMSTRPEYEANVFAASTLSRKGLSFGLVNLTLLTPYGGQEAEERRNCKTAI